jgi:hypothetical protein
VRDERPHALRVLRHEGECVDCATAGSEQVDRPRGDRLDEAMQVVGVNEGVTGLVGSVFTLRSLPRGSYVTTVRSEKCCDSVPNPAALIGEAISNRIGSVLASLRRMSYVRAATGTSRIWVVICVVLMVILHLSPGSRVLCATCCRRAT